MNCIKLSVLGMASLLVGCAVEEEPNLQEHEPQPAIALNKIALNGIVANRVVATSVAENSLAVGRVGSHMTVNPVGSSMLNSIEGREYFAYIVSCAVPAGQFVDATVSGQPVSFEGNLGLAPDWETRAMTDSEKRWVSACLLSRVNAYGISVQISMRGEHPSLAPIAGEEVAFPQAEGAFYGNVFSTAQEKMVMIACRGEAQAAGEGGGLADRDCTEPAGNGLTKCGMTYAGDCLDYSPQTPSAYACSFSWAGAYYDCHTHSSRAMWEPGTGHNEVITTYVAN